LAFQLKIIGIPEKQIKGLVKEFTGLTPELSVILQNPQQEQIMAGGG